MLLQYHQNQINNPADYKSTKDQVLINQQLQPYAADKTTQSSAEHLPFEH
jgi:hypothetical protein